MSEVGSAIRAVASTWSGVILWAVVLSLAVVGAVLILKARAQAQIDGGRPDGSRPFVAGAGFMAAIVLTYAIACFWK